MKSIIIKFKKAVGKMFKSEETFSMMEKRSHEQSQIGGKENLLVGRDLNIVNTGLDYLEVKEIVKDVSISLWRRNFPRLRQDALIKAEENVNLFISKLDRRIQLTTNLIDLNRFKDPDIQYSLNDAVQAAARKGSDIDLDILTEMVCQKIAADKRDLKSITAEEAIRVLPRLSGEHISFLTFVLSVSSIKFNANTFEELDDIFRQISLLADRSPNISMANKKHLEYVGALSIDTLLLADIITKTIKTYSHIPDIDNILNNGIEGNMVSKCLHEYNENKLYKVRLTTVGEMIGLANLKSHHEIDYGIFIK